jgi:hypothetical protein
MSQPPIKRLALPPKDGGLGWSERDIRKQLGDEVASVIQEVVLAHTWDFAMKIDSSVTSTVSVADYELAGTKNDCLDIYTLKYDDDYLVKKTLAALRDITSRRTITAVTYWTIIERNSGLPTVKITGTPGETGKTIKYRYWRNDVKLAECPVALDYLLQVTLAKRLVASYQKVWESALVNAVSAYERPGVDPNITVMDKEVTNGNTRRAKLHGWGG